MVIYPYLPVKTCVLGAQKNIGTDLLSIHNICFGGEIRKLILSGVLI